MGAVKTDHGKIKASLLWNIVFGLTMLVYIAGLFIPIMEPDAAVYAQVSMEMHDRGDYLSIYHKGVDWLDKPHFPFWMSALSYEVFGVNAFAYKLPAIFFILLGAVYTYMFGKRYYSPLHGWLAVILLITAEHIIISNQDVRAEPFMTGLMIMGLYHLTRLVRLKSSKVSLAQSSPPENLSIHFILGSLALACLIMTKGLFTIIPDCQRHWPHTHLRKKMERHLSLAMARGGSAYVIFHDSRTLWLLSTIRQASRKSCIRGKECFGCRIFSLDESVGALHQYRSHQG